MPPCVLVYRQLASRTQVKLIMEAILFHTSNSIPLKHNSSNSIPYKQFNSMLNSVQANSIPYKQFNSLIYFSRKGK